MLTPVQQLRLSSTRGRIALLATVLASSTALLDSTIVNVALPHIADDLDTGVTGLQWVINGYLLTLASLILLGGALGDRFGRRRVFVIGAVWFGASSLLCAVAPNVLVLVVARMLQGIGGALLTPTSLALTQSSFVRDDRGKAVGAWSGLGGLAGAVGPLVGGWLVQGPGWRWAFLINVPLVALTLIASRAVPESRREVDPARSEPTVRFDIGGAVIGAVTLGALTWAITEAPERGWTDVTVLVPLVVSVVGALAFIVNERSVPDPLVPAVLFRSRTFTVLNVATFTLYGAIGAQFFLIVYQLQVAAGWSAIAAGSALVPATVLMLFGSAASGDVASRIGPRPQLVLGPLLLAFGLLLLSRVGEDAEWVTDILPGALLLGLGLVTFVAPLTASVMASVDDALVSTASGVNNAVARTGSLLAVAVLPAVAGLSTAHGPGEVTDAYRTAMMVAAVLAVVSSAIAAVGLPRRPGTAPSARRYHCAVDAAPLQPDPKVCPPPGDPAGIPARGD
jgi:EmrB/QacA subfamily drug resistance transporter